MPDFQELVFGIGSILRENIPTHDPDNGDIGWSTSGSGNPNVYPDHPPLDLSKTSYPRATVDQIAYTPTLQDVENNVLVGSAQVQVTIYTVNSVDAVALAGDVHSAILKNHDGTDDNGNPYLDTWSFEQDGPVSNIMEQKSRGQGNEGFTRYQKSTDFYFETVNT